MTPIATADVAKKVGISESTLERWLAEGNVKPPRPIQLGRRAFRLWTEADIERVRRYKKKNYWKGRGKKPKPKQ